MRELVDGFMVNPFVEEAITGRHVLGEKKPPCFLLGFFTFLFISRYETIKRCELILALLEITFLVSKKTRK